ncbi:MAG TPA: pyridoxamine 5'-phosphate oxidase family protein [Prevotella sp.]
MKYNNDEVRRRDRLMDEARARRLLADSEYGVLSMVDEHGLPYGIPVNYVWDGTSAIYIHCAPEGRKLQAIAAHPAVSFCIVGRVNLLPHQFTTEYESVVLKGTARADLDAEERMHALHLLVDKLSADYKELGRKYSEKSFHRVQIIRIDFTEFSGKRKEVHGG